MQVKRDPTRLGGCRACCTRSIRLSFADSNADGYGDLQGIADHLDHLEWLGIDAIWLSPITSSPNADWGYDVSDYCGVQPEMGTLDAFDGLIAEAHRRGIRVVLDFVPNHTSEEHPWFVDSRSSKTARHRDWYVWADGRPDGSTPNNWVSSFGGPGWTLDARTGQYYMHNHLREQPDLNWWNEEVRDTFDDIVRFWFDRGVDGFRIDVCNIIIKDAELRDNPPATADDPIDEQMFGQRAVYSANRPELHEILRRWRKIADSYDPPRLLLGETPVDDAATLASYLRGRTSTSCSSRSTSRSSTRRSKHLRCGRWWRGSRRCCRRARGRRGRDRTTTCSGSRPAGRTTTRRRRGPRW